MLKNLVRLPKLFIILLCSMELKSVTTIQNLKGKRVLLRTELNIESGDIKTNYRFTKSLDTINYLVNAGARVVLVAHIGRDPENTLKPIYDVLKDIVPTTWAGGVTGSAVTAKAHALQPGQVLILENVRSDEREAVNDAKFAKALAAMADVYVNDAFANMHRSHASMLGVTNYLPAYAGLNVIAEMRGLSAVMQPTAPAVLILGGAKFETKQPLVERYLETYDHIILGGALANDFYKARGLEIGRSLTGDAAVAEQLLHHPKIIVPEFVIVETATGERIEKAVTDVTADEKIMDAGLAAVEQFVPVIQAAHTILWNGPLGAYELGYEAATEALARVVADAPGYSVLGGGDTVSAVQKLGINDQFDLVSTGGGAMLTILEEGTTPVLKTLQA